MGACRFSQRPSAKNPSTDVNQTGYYVTGDPFLDLGEPYLDTNEIGALCVGRLLRQLLQQLRVSRARAASSSALPARAPPAARSTLAIGVEHLLIMSTSTPPLFVGLVRNVFTVSRPGVVSRITPPLTAAPTSGIRLSRFTDQNGNPMAPALPSTAARTSARSMATERASRSAATLAVDRQQLYPPSLPANHRGGLTSGTPHHDNPAPGHHHHSNRTGDQVSHDCLDPSAISDSTSRMLILTAALGAAVFFPGPGFLYPSLPCSPNPTSSSSAPWAPASPP